MPTHDDDSPPEGGLQNISMRDAKGGTAIPPAAPQPVPAATADIAPGGPLTQMMALPEPQRTEALERAVQAGQVFTIRSRTEKIERVLYGEFVLEVPPAPGKPFTAGHAIHLLWTASLVVDDKGKPTILLEEVEG